jgi:hypothetical protein
MFYFRCIFYTFYTNTGKEMITEKIKALFSFVDFLHSNIGSFQKYNDLIKELELLKVEKNKLNPESNYKEKIKFDSLQLELESKFDNLQENTANLIKAKAREFDICNFENELNYNFNGVQEEIHQLKKGFSNEDLPEIFKHKSKYLEYRNQTHKTYLSLSFFFDELDKITKSLFDYFKDNEQNEFESFETKSIQVNDISEAFTLLIKGYNKFIIPTLNTDSKQRLSNSLSDINFFQIYFETNGGKEYNNSSIIKPENWSNLRDNFFNQRMEIYKASYTQNEKINLELEYIENLTINKTDYKILKDRYKEYLKSKQNPPQESETFNSEEVYKTQNLFKVGLLFANGTMNKFFTITTKNKTIMKDGYSAPKIAEELKNSSYNKYILASINNYTVDKQNGNKNIFNSFDMMTKIISDCEAKNIPVDAYFKSRLPIE